MGYQQLQEGTVWHLQQLGPTTEGELVGPDPIKHCCRFNGLSLAAASFLRYEGGCSAELTEIQSELL